MLSTYRRFKKNTSLRKFARPGLVTGIKATEQAAFGLMRSFQTVHHQSRYRAICHIGLQKTGTVWFREMLSDIEVYKSSGLHFKDRAGKLLPTAGSLKGIYSPIRRFDREVQRQIASDDIAVIAVIRDPVALTLSWLKSTTNYHISGRGDPMATRRQDLSVLDRPDQIQYAVNFLKSKQRFTQFEDIIEFSNDNPSCVLLKYEDCTQNPRDTFRDMFERVDIKMNAAAQDAFNLRHSFKAYTGRSISDTATLVSPLQGRTHLDAKALPDDERERIIGSVGRRWAAHYGYS